jgi:hypothetical protein
MPSDGKSSLCLWQGELTKKIYTFPSLTIVLFKISEWVIA